MQVAAYNDGNLPFLGVARSKTFLRANQQFCCQPGRTIERDGCIGPIVTLFVSLSRACLFGTCVVSQIESAGESDSNRIILLSRFLEMTTVDRVSIPRLLYTESNMAAEWIGFFCRSTARSLFDSLSLFAALTSIYLCSILLLNSYSYFILCCCWGCWLLLPFNDDDDVLWSRSQSILNIILIFLTHHQLIVSNDQ